jgi:hypothetical protein
MGVHACHHHSYTDTLEPTPRTQAGDIDLQEYKNTNFIQPSDIINMHKEFKLMIG